MISKLTVENFYCFKNKAVLDLKATKLKGLPKNIFEAPDDSELLKTITIFGANASGKSKLLLGFKALEYMVKFSSSFKPGEEIEPYEPYKLDLSSENKPVTLELEFYVTSIKYHYAISFDRHIIHREELYFYPKGTRASLFLRTKDNPIQFGEYYRGGKKTIEKLVLPNQSFLGKAAENNVDSLMEVYKYLTSNLDTVPYRDSADTQQLTGFIAKILAENKNDKFAKLLVKILCGLDTGIVDIEAKKLKIKDPEGSDRLPKEVLEAFRASFSHQIVPIHKRYSNGKYLDTIIFDYKDESDGTRELLSVAGIILLTLLKGSVMIIDELEKSLHPNIVRYLISLFHNPLSNPRNAQLIFATHDATQLSSEIFRRDQIYLTEKDEKGGSTLTRASKITGIRLDSPLDKWYLSGRFGGTPIIDDIDFLLELQNSDDGSEE